MKKIILLSLLLILSSCSGGAGSGETLSGATKTPEKTPFLIKTQKLSDFSGSTVVEKTGRITASSSLTLTSKGAGEVGKIFVKEGQYVRAGATVAVLRDTVNNFDLRLDQAENALIQQAASIASTEANMNGGIDAARIGLARARLAYESAMSRKNISSLSLSTANIRIIESHNILYRNYLTDLERQMTQMLYSADKILGITSANEYTVDPWKANLGAKNSGTYATALSDWNKLYGTRGELRARIEKGVYISAGKAQADLEYVTTLYDKIQGFADAMLTMLQNTVVGGGLDPMMQSGWLAEWNGVRAQIQGSIGAYGGWQSQVLGFLKTYEATEKANDLAVASLTRPLTTEEKALLDGSNDMKVTYETTRVNLRDSMENARLGVEQAQSSYENALTVKTATLSQMRALRVSAEIGLAQARRDYAKLAITAPVEGTITKLLTSVGDTINPGSPIADFAGKKPEIIIDIDPTLAKSLGVSDSVDVMIGEEKLKGRITAVSDIAGANLLSTIRIALDRGEKYIGETATVSLSTVGMIQANSVKLPIDALKIISEGEGEVSILTKDKTIIRKSVKIENIGGTNVEISGDLTPGDIIIVTDLSNYDTAKNTLEIQ